MTDRWRRTTWQAGLVVAVAAGAATAHGLYEVATAAGQPSAIALLYPLITDGLALVAYSASVRLAGWGLAYAASVVVLAAGLSGLAQASQLAGGLAHEPPVAIRFAIGAWVAVAFLLASHLVWLMRPRAGDVSTVPQAPAQAHAVPVVDGPARATSEPSAVDVPQPVGTTAELRDLAREIASRYHADSDQWISDRKLAAQAGLSRRAAAAVLADLKRDSNGHHVAHSQLTE